VLSLKQDLPFIVQRTGDQAPSWSGMYLAHTASVAGNWDRFWDGKSMYEVFANTQVCPDDRTHLIIWHGTADRNVPYTDSEDFKTLWESKGWRSVTLQLHPDKPHAWDYNEPLTPDLRDLLHST
jgi:hypothetical protein